MNITKKPSRHDLLKVINTLQKQIGTAMMNIGNDRNPNGYELGQKELQKAHALCIDALGFDDPVDG